MEIVISVRVSDDLKNTAVARCEELLVHGLVADNAFVESAVILRKGPRAGLRHEPDEYTRQER